MIRNFIYCLAAILLFLSIPFAALYAQTAGEEQEVYLTFRYQNLVGIYVTAYYRDGDFFLPHNDLFRSLQLDARREPANNRISGYYIDIGEYLIDLDRLHASFNERELELTADDFIIRELDIYFRPYLFRELFGLDFSVDFNNLRLTLQADDTLPIELERERERRRQQVIRTQTDPFSDYYALRYDRQRHHLNGGFFDYNLSANITENMNNYLYTTGFGMEVLGGDLQGNVFGSYSDQASSLRTNNLRWRYALQDEKWLSQVITGQTLSDGLVRSAFTGLKLTNEPVEPRFLFDDYAFTGMTTPDSEVELYRNNTLIAHQQADGLGNYRFQIPLTYGTSQYSIRIYSPTGQVSQRQTRLQVPFNFVPPGEINYTVEGGRLDNPIPGTPDRGFMTKGSVRGGINNWLTAGGGVEYYENYHGGGLPSFSTFLSSRISDHYILSAEAATEAFVRLNAGALYPSSTSIDASFTHFVRQGGIYNPGRNINNLRLNLFTPFRFGDIPFYFRATLNRDKRSQTETYRYNLNLNTRINRFSFRLGYRDTQFGSPQLTSTSLGRLSTAVTYTLPRRHSVPNLLRGIFLQARTNYAPSRSEFEDLEFQLSRNFMQRGRLQLTAGHNFLGNFNFLSASLSIDFNSFRSNSVARSNRNRNSITQSIRGSIGFDSKNERVILNNRQQVGRSAVAVRMFVDHTNSGIYEEGDELIADRAIRIERAGSTTDTQNGITYLSQLQPYRRYNMSINKNAIRNPLLVPLVENFSIVTDPNQYKVIDIPLYMSGVIEGSVLRNQHGTLDGVPGLRLILEQNDPPEGSNPYSEELRTFSDGSFYAYEIHPGSYTLRVDPSQLEILDVVSVPETIEFEIEAVSDGDYKDRLNFELEPRSLAEDQAATVTDDATETEPEEDIAINILHEDSEPFTPEAKADDQTISGKCRYFIQLGSYFQFNGSVNIAEQVKEETGFDINLYYNPSSTMYGLFSGDYNSIDATLQDLNYLEYRNPEHQFAVLADCTNYGYDDEASQHIEPLKFEIELNTFNSIEDAREFVEKTFSDYSFDVEIREITEVNDRSYIIVSKPYQTYSDAVNAGDEFESKGLTDNPHITYNPESISDKQLSFRLLMTMYKGGDDLSDDLTGCTGRVGERCTLMIEESQHRYLIIGEEFHSWSGFTQFHRKISDRSGDENLVIYILNR